MNAEEEFQEWRKGKVMKSTQYINPCYVIDDIRAAFQAALALGRKAGMEWTKETPTEPGLYWLDREDGDKPSVVEVTKSSYDGYQNLEMWRIGCEYELDLDERITGRWYGPIEPPEFTPTTS